MTQPSNPNTALLVMVHGSPNPLANTTMYDVVEIVRQRGVYGIVEVGFMECNDPSIPDAIDRCVEQGVARIDAVPYFLHVGRHVSEDLPALLEEAAARYPDIEFRMGEYLGQAPQVAELLGRRAAAALRGAMGLSRSP